MSRSVLGLKKVSKLNRRFPELDIEKAWARGNTGHRLDLCLKDGTIAYLWPDGTLERSSDRWTAPASMKRCPECKGTGQIGGSPPSEVGDPGVAGIECPTCKGFGEVVSTELNRRHR